MPKWLQSILDLSLDRLLLLVCFSLIVLSLDPIRYQNMQLDFHLNKNPNIYLLLPGGILLILFLWRQREHQTYNASMGKIKEGFKLKFDFNHAISVTTGKIEDFSGGDNAAVVLPANTVFDDQCIRDNRSALGSFCLKHFPSGIDDIQKIIRKGAIEICNNTEESFTIAPPGTAVFLDKPLGSEFRMMISAVTSADSERGITADTLSLLSAIKKVFRLASQNRISSLTMPVMGTGHGGLDFKAALSLLLVQCVHL